MSDLRTSLGLSYVPRWVIVPMLRQQTVSDHSWRVAMIALRMAVDLNVADCHYYAVAALLHDVHEAITGDIPSTNKGKPKFDEMTDAELLVKVADYIETLTWAELWAHPGVRTDIVASVRGRYVEAMEVLNRRIPGAMNVAMDTEREVIYGR